VNVNAKQSFRAVIAVRLLVPRAEQTSAKSSPHEEQATRVPEHIIATAAKLRASDLVEIRKMWVGWAKPMSRSPRMRFHFDV
jgi:hypothetical protein